jgi:hypothetical protein
MGQVAGRARRRAVRAPSSRTVVTAAASRLYKSPLADRRVSAATRHAARSPFAATIASEAATPMPACTVLDHP